MSKKTYIIERIFNERWNADTASIGNALVTLTELQSAIDAYNKEHPGDQLSSRNPANFIKDFIRNRESANRNFPESVLQRRFTLRQVTGGNNAFEFVELPQGQTAPFPIDTFVPNDQTSRHRVETVSLPLASRRLGRSDEPWLVQVVVRLRILETHLSLHSPHNVIQLDHLQMGVKLYRTEIDALFLAIVDGAVGDRRDQRGNPPADDLREIIVTCEAKGLRDDILLDQIRSQVRAVFGQRSTTQDILVPVAVKAIGPSRIYVVEFEAISRETGGRLDGPDALRVASDAIYELVPPIPGIGE